MEKILWVLSCWVRRKTFTCVECRAPITSARAYHDLFCADCRARFWEHMNG